MANRVNETKSEQRAANVTNDTISDFIREAGAAKREVEEANGRYRSILKRAKATGCNQGEIVAALQAKKQDPDQVLINLRDKVRYLGIVGVPVTKGGLFDDLDFTDLAPETQEKDQHWAAEEAGYTAGKANGSRDDNPFPPGAESHVAWDGGYIRGKQALAGTEPEGAKTASTRRSKQRDAAPLH